MKYVLDTTAFSALVKGERPVGRKIGAARKEDVSVPQPVLAESAYGIERLGASKRRALLEERFLILRDDIRRAEWTDEVSEAFASIKSLLEKRGQRLEDFDLAIAAHALATGATLVTSNTAHMARIPGLRIEDWAAD